MAPLRGQKSDELGPASPIPDKLYFKIGEVSKLVGVQAHVLRYWQSEIPAIRPSKSASNQRRYRYRDVEIFREIRRLLYEERYTLAGARKRVLSRESRETDEPGATAEAASGRSPGAASASPPAAGAPATAPAQAAPGPAQAPPTRSALPVEPKPAPAALPPDGVVSLPRVGGSPRGASPAAAHREEDELVQRLRRGLKDLIRLAGEEP